MGKKFVLIHGAWHGGWVWDGVISELEKAGHTAEAPTMPGHNPGDDRSGITFNDYADKIVKILESQSEPVTLVGHSSGAFMIQSAAQKVPAKVAHLIFHNGFILPDGIAQFDLVPPEVAQGMTAAAEASPDNCVPVDEGFVRGVLMSEETKDVQDAVISRLVPQPLALFTTKMDFKDFYNLNTPKTVVFCKDDISLPPGAYLGMAQNLGEFALIELPGGHETMFARPNVVADALIKAVS
jgi:pimeloyl-ACP methyl ester carboxylesterase